MSLFGGGGCSGWWWDGHGALVDVDIHDVDVVKDINILSGYDNDVVDIDNILIGNVF